MLSFEALVMLPGPPPLPSRENYTVDKQSRVSENLFLLLTFPISIPMIILLTLYPKKAAHWGSHLPRRPRFINWIWALWGAFFWLPCPICHRNFGGHEGRTGSGSSLMITLGSGEGVCWRSDCASVARERNKIFYAKHGMIVLP